MSPRNRRPRTSSERPVVACRMVSDRSPVLHAHMALALEALYIEEDRRLATPTPEECVGKRRLRVTEPSEGLNSE